MKTTTFSSKKYAYDFSSINAAKAFAKENNGKTCTIVEKEDDNMDKFFEFGSYTDKGVSDLREVDGSNLIYENIDEWKNKEEFFDVMENELGYNTQLVREMWNALCENGEITHTQDSIIGIEYYSSLNNKFFAVEY